jgi:hypothetical protein
MLDPSRECRCELTVSFARLNVLSQSVDMAEIARASNANLLKRGIAMINPPKSG